MDRRACPQPRPCADGTLVNATKAPPRTQDLSEGALGIALLHIERGDLACARDSLAQAVAGGVSAGNNASLFHGAPALEFVLSRAGCADRDVRDTVDRVVNVRLAAARRRQACGSLPHLAEFDLIRGLTGLGALLLTRSAASPQLKEVLAYLVSLARPVRIEGRELPGWWSAAGPGGEEMDGGHSNNGVAHGICGVLAVLSLAVRHQVQVPGQYDAIEVFARWLCHGWAGLVAIARAVADDSSAPDRFTSLLEDPNKRLATDLDRLPKPGFMEGRAGAQLALDGTNTTDWTSALLDHLTRSAPGPSTADRKRPRPWKSTTRTFRSPPRRTGGMPACRFRAVR
jgi:hypothetical protein